MCQYSQSFENTTNSFAFSFYWRSPRTHSCLHSWLSTFDFLHRSGWMWLDRHRTGLNLRTNFLSCTQPCPETVLCFPFWKLFHTFSLQLPSYSPPISILKNRSYQMKIPSSHFQTHNPVFKFACIFMHGFISRFSIMVCWTMSVFIPISCISINIIF